MEDDKKNGDCFSILTSPFCEKRNWFNQTQLFPTYMVKETKNVLVLVVARANSENL